MDHSYFQERISAYSDRDLDPYDLRAVEEHLESCHECRELLKRLEKLDAFVEENRSLKDDEYWESSAQKIEAVLDPVASTEVTDISPRSWKALGWKLTAAAASIAALAFIGLHETELYDEIREDSFQTAPSKISKPTERRRRFDSAQSPGRKAIEFVPSETGGETESKAEPISYLPAPSVKKMAVRKEKSASDESTRMDEETAIVQPASNLGAGEGGKRDALLADKEDDVASRKPKDMKASSAQVLDADKIRPRSLANQAAGKTKGVTDIATGDRSSFTGADEAEVDQATLLLWRDSLMSIFRLAIVDSFDDVSEVKARALAEKSAAEHSDKNLSTPVLKLLEVQYLIGKSTQNRMTYDSVLVFLDSLQNHGDTTVSKQAASYLNKLRGRKDW